MYNMSAADVAIQKKATSFADELIPYEEYAEFHDGNLPEEVDATIPLFMSRPQALFFEPLKSPLQDRCSQRSIVLISAPIEGLELSLAPPQGEALVEEKDAVDSAAQTETVAAVQKVETPPPPPGSWIAAITKNASVAEKVGRAF